MEVEDGLMRKSSIHYWKRIKTQPLVLKDGLLKNPPLIVEYSWFLFDVPIETCNAYQYIGGFSIAVFDDQRETDVLIT
jgi:hypothetical protein